MLVSASEMLMPPIMPAPDSVQVASTGGILGKIATVAVVGIAGVTLLGFYLQHQDRMKEAKEVVRRDAAEAEGRREAETAARIEATITPITQAVEEIDAIAQRAFQEYNSSPWHKIQHIFTSNPRSEAFAEIEATRINSKERVINDALQAAQGDKILLEAIMERFGNNISPQRRYEIQAEIVITQITEAFDEIDAAAKRACEDYDSSSWHKFQQVITTNPRKVALAEIERNKNDSKMQKLRASIAAANGNRELFARIAEIFKDYLPQAEDVTCSLSLGVFQDPVTLVFGEGQANRKTYEREHIVQWLTSRYVYVGAVITDPQTRQEIPLAVRAAIINGTYPSDRVMQLKAQRYLQVHPEEANPA